MNKDKKNILIVTTTGKKDNGLSAWIESVNNSNKYKMEFVETDERAIDLSNKGSYEMVIIDHTIQDINALKLNAVLPILQDELMIIHYKGESSEHLNALIEEIEQRKKYQRIKRLLIMDSNASVPETMPGFSAN